jgi:hypothetical protein
MVFRCRISRLSALPLVLALFVSSTMQGPVHTVKAQRMSAANRERVVFGVSLSPDGKTLAIARGTNSSSTQFSRVELWNVADGSLRHTIRGFDGQVWSVSFSPDGNTLVTGSSEFRNERIQERNRRRESLVELKWWDAKSGDLKKKLTLPEKDRLSLIATYSPDGRLVATVESYIYAMTPILFGFAPKVQKPEAVRLCRRMCGGGFAPPLVPGCHRAAPLVRALPLSGREIFRRK